MVSAIPPCCFSSMEKAKRQEISKARDRKNCKRETKSKLRGTSALSKDHEAKEDLPVRPLTFKRTPVTPLVLFLAAVLGLKHMDNSSGRR